MCCSQRYNLAPITYHFSPPNPPSNLQIHQKTISTPQTSHVIICIGGRRHLPIYPKRRSQGLGGGQLGAADALQQKGKFGLIDESTLTLVGHCAHRFPFHGSPVQVFNKI